MATYHAPQMKYWRNIIAESFSLMPMGMSLSRTLTGLLPHRAAIDWT
jgi:hypothetical protein